ncbi:MAG: ATP-binding protein [Lewinellaceae bacterium]|nr:ATP-binding protein [Lewinellaceae bacterium]
MDPVKNPYRPGAGLQPGTLAGREKVIEKAEILLKRVKAGAPQRSIMLYGLRGMGKTVLLNRFREIARGENYIVHLHEMSEKDDFKSVITRAFKKILLEIDRVEQAKDLLKKAFRVLKSVSLNIPEVGDVSIDLEKMTGWGDSGNFESDLVDLVESIGQAAKEYQKFVCILIDETQYIDERSLAALIAANHNVSQSNLPIVFICAGLPQILALTGDAKSYAERLFEFVKINGLSRMETMEAIVGPARNLGVLFDPEAVEELSRLTGGYPYFIQEFCKFVWDTAPREALRVTKADVLAAQAEAQNPLDDSFFKIRLDRATDGEKRLMRSMSEMGSGPYKWNDVIEKMDKASNTLSPVRASLIKKGFLYAPAYGVLDFTVPKFDDFLRRHFSRAA